MWGQPPSAVRRAKPGGVGLGCVGTGAPTIRAERSSAAVEKGSYLTISAIFPLAISSASRAKSWYITRSFSIVAHTDRIAA